MRKLVSFVLGGALLLGAATLGLPSGTANAAAKHHDRDYWRHHHHRYHRRYRRNHLSW